MKIKLFVITLLLLLIWLAFTAFLLSAVRRNNQTIERLESNISAIQSAIVIDTAKHTANVKQQTLTKSELKEVIHSELKSLNIKERDVNQAISTQTETRIVVKTDTVREIIFGRDTTNEYEYHDNWVDVQAGKDSIRIASRDSILIINHAKTRKFLWWTWKKYSGETTVKNYSPYTQIVGMTSIYVEK